VELLQVFLILWREILECSPYHHRQKKKLLILGVARIVLCEIFLASIFVVYVEPKLFFSLSCRKILQCNPY